MPDLPSGTVTFLFTDIEGSTRLLDELGADGYATALAQHQRVIRAACAANDGVEVDTQGDAFFVAFATADGALAAARAISDGLATGQIRVRIGIHTGTPVLTGDGYVGADVHLGARIAAAGHGGQVLISRATRDLLAAAIDEDITDLGEHRVKDFSEAVWIYQLGAGRFPPLRTISNTNLPRPASSFVGRDREVNEISALLHDGARLLTLTGPGGTGKTRLAIEAAAALIPEFKSGVFWVDLASLRDPALVPETIGQTIGATDGLADHIGERELLLLLDNLEQVIGAAPELATLVEACPRLRLLVTSRERLRVRGEVEYPVAPLIEDDAVALFCERAGTEPEATIEELCQALDELPLAIELAAARASYLSPAQILERLSGRLDLLKGGRDADPRQLTLRATIEWSHELLAPAEQRLIARLAVFRGGCTLEAAEKIADADLDSLGSLVDKSLLRHLGDRFMMLETIRQYEAERLETSGEADTLRRRHADFFLALAEEAEPHLRGTEPRAWMDRLRPEGDNFRAALDRLVAWADEDGAQRLAGALDEFWLARNEAAEGRRHLAAVLEIDDEPTPARAKALVAAARLARDHGDPAAARSLAEQGLAVSRRIGDRWATAHSTLLLGASVADQREFLEAERLFEEAAPLFEELGDGYYALYARRLRAWMRYELGDRNGARTMHEANLVRARELGARDLQASILGALSEYAVDDGRVDDALALSAEGLRLRLEGGDQLPVANELCKCANALALAGRCDVAVQLIASASAWFEAIGSTPWPHLTVLIEQVLDSCRAQLDAVDFEAARQTGMRLALEKAAALALDTLEKSAAGTTSPGD